MIDYYKIMQEKLKLEDKDLLLNIQKMYNKEITKKSKNYSLEDTKESIEDISKKFDFKKKGKLYKKKIPYKDFLLEIELDIKTRTLKSRFIFNVELEKNKDSSNTIIISQENYYEEPKQIKQFEFHFFTNKDDKSDFEITHTYIQHMISPFYVENELYGYNYEEKHEKLKESSFFNIDVINFFLENYNKIDEVADLITLQKDIVIQNDILMDSFIDTFKAFQQTHLRTLNKRQRMPIKNI